MFHRYDLRTTDVAAARGFYEAVLARPLDPALSVIPLPEPARARGAPAHWLGHLAVDDPAAAAEVLLRLGGERRGPAFADPVGAMIALDPPAAVSGAVAWHQLNTREPERAWAAYTELVAWTDAGTLPNGYRMFAWRGGAAPAGGVFDIRAMPQAHTAWLYFFAVDDLDAALDRARAANARFVSEPSAIRHGGRAAYLDDAQGAAFGLIG